MNKLRTYRMLIICLLCLSDPLARAQSSSARLNKSAESVSSKQARPSVNTSARMDRLQGRFQPETALQLNRQTQRLPDSKRHSIPAPSLLFLSAMLGAMFFMTLFTTGQYLFNWDAVYGWYATYLVVTSLWLGQSASLWVNGIPLSSDSKGIFMYIMLLGCGMMVTYIRFISYLLEVPQQHPHLERRLLYFYKFVAALMLISIAELLLRNSLYVYSIANVLFIGGMLILLTETLRRQHPLKPYALTGSALLLSGTIISFLVGVIGPGLNNPLIGLPLGQMAYMAIGTLLEVLCFSLALGRRFQLTKEEKIQAQEQLIQQLEENGRLQQRNTVELERQLAQRETEVLTKAHELEDQRVDQLRSDFERRTAEAEMAGLRSQMNPHFIFNCLNSIKLYATENESEKASDYLTKFSRLIRMVLENSRSERVTLQDELHMLRLYADLEIMRFKQKLSVSIDVAPDLDTRFLEIPPLLLQPYVENAIWHGLMHKPEGGSIHVRVTLPQDDLLQLSIADDGVGRARAAELKSKSASHRKSFGLKMTSERIALVNQLYQTHTQVTIHDLINAEGQSAGTEVVLQIPI